MGYILWPWFWPLCRVPGDGLPVFLAAPIADNGKGMMAASVSQGVPDFVHTEFSLSRQQPIFELNTEATQGLGYALCLVPDRKHSLAGALWHLPET